jgi:PKD repeat protein
VSFTDQSSGDVTSWDWDFGDGGTSTQQNPSHEYTSAGDYTVSLTATGPCGSDIETKTDYIQVGATLVADFSGTPTSGCAPLTVSFTDQSSGDVTSWEWDFGDGGTSTLQNPSHEYASAGDYTVTLTVTGACGTDSETKTGYISVGGPPLADFYGTPTSGETPLTVSFTDQSSGDVTSWDWDFGDGGISTLQNPSHEYAAAGDYTVALTVTGSCGSDTETKTGYITVTEPGTGFCDDFGDGDASDWTVIAGTWSVVSQQYDGVNTGGKGYSLAPAGDMADGTITVDWTSLTGGNWTNGQIFFGWQDTGNYRCVDMRDGANKWFIREFVGGTRYNRAVTEETINTNQQYHMEVTIAPGGYVTVYVDGVEKVSYDFGNVVTGPVGVGIEKAHAQFDNFCTTSEPPPEPPVADFAGSPTSGCAPLAVSFTDQSTGVPTSWSWDFGDGGSSTEQNPSHTYNEAGTYTVALTATNGCGSDTETKTDYITVTEPSADAMHVHDIVVSRNSFWWFSRGIATVTVYDQSGSPVSSATVYGSFSGPLSQSASGSTDGNGQVTFYSNWTSGSGEWCFEVTDLVKTDWTYDSAANVVTKACESGYVNGQGREVLAQGASEAPISDRLHQNYPDPFRGSTTICFDLAEASQVRLEVYSVTGRRVATLVDGVVYPGGRHALVWNASGLASGVYFYRIKAGSLEETRKMLVTR